MQTRSGPRWSILPNEARRQFQTCVLLITVIPSLAIAFLLIQFERGGAVGWGSWLVVGAGLACIVVLGYVLLGKYPATVAKLRSRLEDIMEEELPEHVEQMRLEDDFAAIETSLSLILERLRERFAAVQLEKARLEEELGHVRYLEAIGTLAAGIAHEISTPLQFISDNTRFLKEATEKLVRALPSRQATAAPDPGSRHDVHGAPQPASLDLRDMEFLRAQIPDAIQQSQEGIRRIAAVVRAMKAYASRDASGQWAEADLNSMIENALEVTRSDWKHVADVTTELADDLPVLTCIPQDMRQVLLSLIGNAAQAVGEAVEDQGGQKGIIRIATTGTQDRITLRVQDSGLGIPEQAQPDIFEPSFTAGEGARNANQDLAMAYWLVTRKHDGAMAFESTVGEGTTFTVSLPLRTGVSAESPDQRESEATAKPPEASRGPERDSQLRILFVDDSESVLWALERTLHVMEGHWKMAFVTSASQAVERLRQRPYDVVVTDSNMPGKNGQELLQEVGDAYPGTGRVLLSGDTGLLAGGDATGLPYPIIAKPCERSELQAAIEEALAAARGPTQTTASPAGTTP
ncbi:MAG: response regulator [Lentisphaerae bacterium]|jgi:signal transduction histidine kinase/ActR/RegA family two-component response regulator|nr:response regulator [Lentisphaerota bacterium]MBT4822778.1 response regulator [Lentisphaerota bacterium]MBT5606884.1 response regulator [Lentisphaerota bacterium]MBT7058330.1 response regulator [Lentisphaerota bacterium]MBT7843603.1 response regulator [Lentisphaerota bacterium]